MPNDVPKAGSVSARIQAFKEREAQAQAEAQKPTTFKSQFPTPRSPAQSRRANPPRQTPSPPPSKLAEATYASKTVVAPDAPLLKPAKLATQWSDAVIAAPVPQVARPLLVPTITAASVVAPGTTPEEPATRQDTQPMPGRRETLRFEWPAGPRTDYAYEHHRRHSLPLLDTSLGPPLPAYNQAAQVTLRHVAPNQDRPPSRLQKLSEADPSHPLAKFRRTDTRKILNNDGTIPSTIASAPASPIGYTVTTNVMPAPADTATLNLDLSQTPPQSATSTPKRILQNVHDRIASIEAAVHRITSQSPDMVHQAALSLVLPHAHTAIVLSPSEQAAHVPGAFFDPDTLPQHPVTSFSKDVQSPTKPALQVVIPGTSTITTVASQSPEDAAPPYPLYPVIVPYYELPSPVIDEYEEELAKVSKVLDKIVLDHRSAVEEITTRLSTELSKMSKDYDNAQVPEHMKRDHTATAPTTMLSEPDMKFDIDTRHHHFPEPHRDIAALLPKLQEQAGILVDLTRQIKEVAAVWSVDLELIDATIDYNALHSRARNLARYAKDAPIPLTWQRGGELFPHELDADWRRSKGWQRGYGLQWGFDGEWTNGLDVLEIQKAVLLELMKCESVLLGIESGIQETTEFIGGVRQPAWIDIQATKAGCVGHRGPRRCIDEAREDVLDIIELYNQL